MSRILNIIVSHVQKDRLHRNRSQSRRINDQIVQIHAADGILVQPLDQRRSIGTRLLLGLLLRFGGQDLQLDEALVLVDEALHELLESGDLFGADVEVWGFAGWDGGGAFGGDGLAGAGEGAIEEGQRLFEV